MTRSRDGVRPFDDSNVVARYEQWYSTAFGRLADELETGMLLDMLAPLAPGATLLEIGCGTAHFGDELARRGFRVVGADPAAAMLAVAKRRIPVARAAAERLPIRSRSVDGAFLVGVLDFVEDPVAVLREARRVARERVAVIALASGSWLALRRRVAAWRGHPIFGAARFRSRAELLEVARSAGAPAERVRGALVMPPMLSGAFAGVERRLARGLPPAAGMIAFSLRASD